MIHVILRPFQTFLVFQGVLVLVHSTNLKLPFYYGPLKNHLVIHILNLEIASTKLEGLEAGGVDNWEWYSDSLTDAGFWDWEEEQEELILALATE